MVDSRSLFEISIRGATAGEELARNETKHHKHSAVLNHEDCMRKKYDPCGLIPEVLKDNIRLSSALVGRSTVRSYELAEDLSDFVSPSLR